MSFLLFRKVLKFNLHNNDLSIWIYLLKNVSHKCLGKVDEKATQLHAIASLKVWNTVANG